MYCPNNPRANERKNRMDTKETTFSEEKMKERGEHPVLALRKEEGDTVLRFLVAETDRHPKQYSIYAEYFDGACHTAGDIPNFSRDRDTAESFCSMLERFGVTPFSLNAIYEDTLTP